MKARIKSLTTLILMFTVILISKGQTEQGLATPNQFHGYRLGAPLSNFSMTTSKGSKDRTSILYSEIKTKNMKVYALTNQLTEGGDKIDIDLFFYDDSLSVIRIAYKDPRQKKKYWMH